MVRMSRSNDTHLLKGEGYRAIWLPFKSGAFGMAIVLPDDPARMTSLTSPTQAQPFHAFLSALLIAPASAISLQLPCFGVATDEDLKSAIMTTGVHRAFSQTKADFSVMQPDLLHPLFISQVRQQATASVDERGALAAAVTIIGAQLACGAGFARVEPFHVDRPFLFYIADHKSGTILFMGRIDDPRG